MLLCPFLYIILSMVLFLCQLILYRQSIRLFASSLMPRCVTHRDQEIQIIDFERLILHFNPSFEIIFVYALTLLFSCYPAQNTLLRVN